MGPQSQLCDLVTEQIPKPLTEPNVLLWKMGISRATLWNACGICPSTSQWQKDAQNCLFPGLAPPMGLRAGSQGRSNTTVSSSTLWQTKVGTKACRRKVSPAQPGRPCLLRVLRVVKGALRADQSWSSPREATPSFKRESRLCQCLAL